MVSSILFIGSEPRPDGQAPSTIFRQTGEGFEDARSTTGFDLDDNFFAFLSDLNEALDCYQRVIELKPDHAPAYKNLGDVLRQKGQLDDAIKCYYKALEIKPDFLDVYILLGDTFIAQGKEEEAQESYRKALEV